MQGESLSANADSAAEFKEHFFSFINDFEYDRDCIYNADESGLMWKVLPNSTLVEKGVTKACGWKLIKDRVTIMVCGNASATDRLPLLMIGKSRTPRCFKNLNLAALPIIYENQKSAWMDATIFKKWYTDVFLPHVFKKHNGKKCILILDNAPTHPAAQELNKISETCSIIYLPPNVTSLIQPMDQGVIEKLKRLYRQNLLRNLLQSESRTNVQQYIKEMNLYKCMLFLSNAWNNVTENNLRNAWNKIFPGNDVGLVRDSEGDVLEIMRHIPELRAVTPELAERWIRHDNSDPGWEILTPQEIAFGRQTDQDEPKIDDDDTEMDDTEEVPSNLLAQESFHKFYKWALSRWDVTETQLKSLQDLQSLVEDVTTTDIINKYN